MVGSTFARFDDFLICDSADDEILRFSFQGEAKGEFVASGAGGLDNPVAAIRSENEVFVAGFSSGVHRLNLQTGSFELLVPSGTAPDQVLSPTDLLLVRGDTDSNLLVTNFQPGGGIKRFNARTGLFDGELVPAGSGGLAFPNSLVALPRSEDFLVSSTGTHEVLRFDQRTGVFEGTFVTRRAGGLLRPRGLAFGPDRNLYVASEGFHPVLRFNGETGEFIDAFVERESGVSGRPSDLFFFDDILHLIIGRQILRFSRTGAPLGSLLAPDSGVRQPACLLDVPGTGRGPEITIAALKITGARESGLFILRAVSATVRDSLFESNVGFFRGGAIRNFGQLQLVRTILRANRAPGTIAGCSGTSGGGALFNAGQAVVTDSTFEDNRSTRGGAIFNFQGSIRIDGNTAIERNTALCGGGGIANVGGDAEIFGSTQVRFNMSETPSAGQNPFVFSGGGIFNSGMLTLGGRTTVTGKLSIGIGRPQEANCHNISTGTVTIVGNGVHIPPETSTCIPRP